MIFLKDLELNSFGSDVYNLQDILERFGYGDFIPTGYFGPKTKAAVSELQSKNKIYPPIGRVGPQTRAFLNAIILKSSEVLYFTAVGCLGIDASPHDVAPDEYGCAETVNAIHLKAFGHPIDFGVSTYQMYNTMLNSSSFIRVDSPRRGDIIISPTGYGNGRLSNGHVGIMASEIDIMSNNSYTGKFEKNYTLQKWRDRYVVLGAYPVVFFRKI